MAKIICDKYGCAANLDGECVSDECRGEIIQMPPCAKSDREMMKKWYNMKADTFKREFPEADIRAQMRQDGLCEEDIELAAKTVHELKERGAG